MIFGMSAEEAVGLAVFLGVAFVVSSVIVCVAISWTHKY